MRKNRFEKRLQFLIQKHPEVYQLILKIEKHNTYWEAFTKLSPEYLGNLKKSVIISSTGSSTRIEGSSLSDEQIEALIYKRNIKEFATRDEQEAGGYMELIKLIFSSYDTIPFTEGTISHFHEMSLHYSEKDQLHKGKYKSESNKVILVENGVQKGVIFDPTPPHLVKGEMIELMEWTRQALKEEIYNPLLIIGNFVFEYLSIHPFKDGNGRTSRLLTNLLLLKNNYVFTPYVSHEQIIEDNKADYYVSLRRSTKNWKTENDQDVSDWMLFFLKIVEKQGAKAVEITKKENTEDFLSSDQIKVWQCFSNKKEWSRKEISEKTKISTNSVNKIFQKLLKMKKIEKIGFGRATRYRKKL